jgi:hypothetical protein
MTIGATSLGGPSIVAIVREVARRLSRRGTEART